jgi:hypothetical protein
VVSFSSTSQSEKSFERTSIEFLVLSLITRFLSLQHSFWKEPNELFISHLLSLSLSFSLSLSISLSLSRLYSFLYLIVISQVTPELNLNHDCSALPALWIWMAYFTLFVLHWSRCAGVRLYNCFTPGTLIKMRGLAHKTIPLCKTVNSFLRG